MGDDGLRESRSSNPAFLPVGLLPLPRTSLNEGRRGSLGSGILGGLLQFPGNSKYFQSMNCAVNGFCAEYESIPSTHQTGADSNKLHKLRDQVRSRSEPCISYMASRRSKPVSYSGSRCLSPITPRRNHSQTSPRLPLLSRYGTSRDSRRWSCHSIPSCPMSSGYITQNSTPPYSACSSSQEKIYCSGVDSVEDLRKCSSLSSSVSSHQLQMEKQDIEDRNIIYREKFPLVREQMESQLEKFIQEEELIEEESCTGGDAVWAFIHKQVIEIARLTLKKSSENSITCRVFADNSERCAVLKDEGKAKSGNLCPNVLKCIRKYFKITSRPSRLLQYVEFDTEEYISILDQLEDDARAEHNAPHRYVLRKLGLDTPTNEADDNKDSSDETDPSREDKPDVKVHENDFEKFKLISQGAYAKVYLVKHRESRQRFAMKRITKSSLQLRNQVQRAFLERDIMTFTENPFVVSMYCAFETQTHLCMIMEFVEGGDVRTLLKNIDTLPYQMAKMYTAEVVLALEYLHSYGIVHRDLKPDNLLITSIGHIKLTDFGLSKVGLMRRATEIYEDRQDEETPKFGDNECVGTPEYLSPEVILQQAYSTDVDWWALGVILYELLHGITPFYAESVEDVFSSICKGELEFIDEDDLEEGDELLNADCRNVIVQLLNIELVARLVSADDIKSHPYFDDVEWDNILRQKAQFIPELSNEDDTSYFDPRCDRYNHNSSDDESAVLEFRPENIQNIQNMDFASSSQKYNSSFRKFETESSNLSSPKSEPCSLTPTGKHPDGRSSLPLDAVTSPNAGLFMATNAAKEIMHHHESKARLIRDSSCDSISDEVFSNRHRISSTSSDPDIKFFISGDDDGSDDEDTTLTPTVSNFQQSLANRRLSNSSESDCNSSLQRSGQLLPNERFRHLSGSSLRRVPKSASTSSIPESRLIIPNDSSPDFTSPRNRSNVNSSNPSSRDSSPNRCASPILGDTRHIKICLSRSKTGDGLTSASALSNKIRKNRIVGFDIMTIPVYIGKSNNYTLHHIVRNVQPGSNAESSGLKQMDLITHINGEIVQGCLNTEVLNMVYSEPDELSITVVPLDSTAISLQQSKSRKTGKLIRKKNNRRLKANRSSCTNLKAKVQTFIPHQTITRSKSFTSRSQRRSPISSERASPRVSPRVSPVSIPDRNIGLSPGSIPTDNVGRTSPRQNKRRNTKPLNKFNSLLSLKDKSRKDSRRKSTGGSNPVHAIVAGGAAKPLSPLASGQHMPLSPLARTPSPGPERYQQLRPFLQVVARNREADSADEKTLGSGESKNH